MSTLVKICGLSEESPLHAATQAGAGMVGFVHFEKSPRHVSLARAAELKALLPAHVKSVLVLVDPSDVLLADIAQKLAPDYLQLHGKETPQRIADIRKTYPTQKIIKAMPVADASDLDAARAYEPYADMLMFDAKPPADATLPGGNGIPFDWKILKNFRSEKPWILSGGLTPENVGQAIRESGAKMVDVSSGVESSPGKKDGQRIGQFIVRAC